MAASSFVRTGRGGWRIDKAPNAKKDYKVDWASWLAGDTIASVEFEVEDGLTEDLALRDFDATTATVWLSGGALAAEYLVTCRITTAAGRIETRSFSVRIREQ